jgi:peptidoglycan DL-endopeptidase CwlO
VPIGHSRLRRGLPAAVAVVVALGLGAPTLSMADPAPTLADVQKRVDQLHREAEMATERYNSANQSLAETQRAVATAHADLQRQQERVTQLSKEIGGFAAASYRSGGVDPSMHVLLADDLGQFLAQASVVDAYATGQLGALRAVARERHRLAERRVSAAERQERLTAIEAELSKHRSAIHDKLAKAQRLLDTLQEEQRAALEREQAAREEASRKAAREAEARLKERQAQAQARTQTQAPAATPTTSASQDSAAPKIVAQSPSPRATQSQVPSASVPTSGKGAVALEFALAQVGEPYVYGGAGPDSWDCSGLTMMAWKAAGVSLPHGAKDQYASTPHVAKADLQPGDLIFFYSPIHHVGVYAGADKVVHAPKPGDVVSVDPLGYMPFAGASRPG